MRNDDKIYRKMYINYSNLYGYTKGFENIKNLVNFSLSKNISNLTVFALSSENFKRGTLRGFHYQTRTTKDSKIITCIRGSILNVT